MRTFGYITLVLALTVAVFAQAEPLEYVPGEILVKPKRSGVEVRAFHETRGARVHRSFPLLGGIQVIKLPPNAPILQIVEAYNASGLVHYAEPNWIRRARTTPNDAYFAKQWNMKNTGHSDQGSGDSGADIKATPGWTWRTSAKDVVVCIIDSGVNYNHPDLADNM